MRFALLLCNQCTETNSMQHRHQPPSVACCIESITLSVLMIVLVLGQNGIGQNGTDKMVWTKWYTDEMVLDKMVRTKWYGQNGMDKTLTIKSSINTLIPLPLTI